MGSSYLPPSEQNVVNVGDELSQSAIDAINAASFPSGTNPFRTINDGGVISAYDNFKVYQTGDVVTEGGLIYVFNSTIGAAGYGPITHPYAWTSMQGQQGPQGPQGDPGPQGQTGDPGPSGPPGSTTLRFLGDWNSYTSYNPGDIVVYSGVSYGAKEYHTNITPYGNPFYWQLVAERGQDGAGGPQGPQGDPGPQGPSGPSIAEWNSSTTYDSGSIATYNGGIFTCLYGPTSGGSYPPDNSAWMLASSNYFAYASTVYDKVNRYGDTFTGKVTMAAPNASRAGLNLGVGTGPSTSVAGDIWIATNINYKDIAGTQKAVANTNTANTFSQPQIIQSPITATTAALRVTQLGTGNAIEVEDSTTPDATKFVVDQFGKVGVGTAPDATACIKVDFTGIKFWTGAAVQYVSPPITDSGTYDKEIPIQIDGVNYRISCRQV